MSTVKVFVRIEVSFWIVGWKLLTLFDVAGDVDWVWEFSDVDFKSVLDIVQDLGVVLVGYEGDSQAFCSESSSSGYSVKVHVGIFGHVVVEDDVYSLDIHTTSKQISCYQDPLLEILELLVTVQPLLLAERSMNADSREVLLRQELGECHAPLHSPHEDNHLVKLQQIQQIKQFPVLLALLQFHVVLLQSVQGQLRFVVHEHFQGLTEGFV